jgi:hypothetical protein
MMASDNKVAAGKKKGDLTSLVLVLSVLAGAGGVGWVLWKNHAQIEQDETSAAVTPAPVASGEPAEPNAAAADPNSKVMRMLNELQSRRIEPAAKPRAAAATRPDPSTGGIITIVSKNGTSISRVAPGSSAAPSQNFAPNVDADPPSNNNSDGPKIYTTRDPNLDKPPEQRRSGKPRYYDFDHKESYTQEDDPQFQKRTTYKSK